MSKPDNVARSAFRASAGSLLSLIIRLGFQVAIAAMFGATAAMDAFFSAIVVPAYVEAVLLTGLSFVFIPAFVRAQESNEQDEAWALAGTFFWITAVVFSVIAILGVLGASQIIAVTAPGLESGTHELAGRMLAVLMLALPIQSIGSLTQGIQHARGRFFGPAFASGIGAIGNLLLVLLLYRSIGPMVLAWGYLLRTVIESSVTVIPVLAHGWGRSIPLRDKRVLEMGRLIAPFILFGVLTRSTGIVERYFASGLPDGQLSSLGYAHRISAVVFSLLGVGLATAIFPAMAREYARVGIAGLVRRAQYGIRLTLAIALPAITVLSVLAVPFVTVLLERGAFDRATTVRVAVVLPAIMISNVLFAMLGNILGRTFYVIKDTVSAPATAFVVSVFYIVLAKWLVERHGLVGLAWAATLNAVIANAVLAVILCRKLPLFEIGVLARSGGKYVAASTVAALIAIGTISCVSLLPVVLQLALALTVAGGVYMMLLLWLDRTIAVSILEMAGVGSIAERLGIWTWLRTSVENDRLSTAQSGDD